MRRLLPTSRDIGTPFRPDDVPTPERGRGIDGEDRLDVEANVAAEARPTPPDRPWVMLNMVTSVDGAAEGPDGKSAPLSSDADRRLFHALRSVADVVLAGARTVRAENYGAPRGEGKVARLATVSASLAFDPGSRFFREPSEPPIVFTTEEALAAGRATSELAAVADLRAAGSHTFDWPTALRILRTDYGARTLLVEGGATLNAGLAAQDLIDELRLTLAPMVVGGPAGRVVAPGFPAAVRPYTLADLAEEDGFLFLRYLRDRH